MFKFPLVILYSIVAFNITAFTFLLQINWLEFQSTPEKLVAWAFTAAAWEIAYLNRHKFYTIRLTSNTNKNPEV